jgi:hypothetical protein
MGMLIGTLFGVIGGISHHTGHHVIQDIMCHTENTVMIFGTLGLIAGFITKIESLPKPATNPTDDSTSQDYNVT